MRVLASFLVVFVALTTTPWTACAAPAHTPAPHTLSSLPPRPSSPSLQQPTKQPKTYHYTYRYQRGHGAGHRPPLHVVVHPYSALGKHHQHQHRHHPPQTNGRVRQDTGGGAAAASEPVAPELVAHDAATTKGGL
ncbi:hypothetical protein SPI_02463 [Niveomyces insectorum RCEF 264]|uniref:Uncharacterized protein n=1 Tax=Niveomyces insectorum RCEF 264 TaxID=1081102 RepID=A0A167Y0Q5_9HYPO|nr:hypothetical protein SPI_02463 [Niveomyces insectorum RCEF 264]